MTTLTLLRGLPASGKTTWAKAQPATRVSRDDLRAMLFDGEGVLPFAKEELITKIEQRIVRDALTAGRDVIVDNMHLRAKYVRPWQRIAHECGAAFAVKEFEITVEESQTRDMTRWTNGERSVGGAAIESMARFLGKGGRLQPVPEFVIPTTPAVEPYVPKPNTPHAIIVDIDGTLARHVDRSPYDYDRLDTDEVIDPIRHLVWLLGDSHFKVIFVSGRPDSHYDQTWSWLNRSGMLWTGDVRLYMRQAGDMRNDAIVKREIFDEHIRDHYDVKYALDDRPQVIRMWASLGLTVLDVDPTSGEF